MNSSAILFVALVVSCFFDGMKFGVKAAITGQTALTMANNSTVVQLREGNELVVTLRGNPSTGFTWSRIDSSEQPAVLVTVLQPSGSAFVYTPETSGLMGAPGNFTFLFQAVQVGCARLKLGYARGWETSIPPSILFVAEVIVI